MAKIAKLLAVAVLACGFAAGCNSEGEADYGGEVKQVDAKTQENFKGRFGDGAAANPTGKPDATAVDVDR